jgi:hypothetical protein
MHGQVFVINPGPGENSIADLRRPPLHYNCRCVLIEISVFRGGEEYAPKGDSSTPFPEWPWIKGGNWFGSLIWCNNNRDASDGPAYGKYGGKNWTAGRNLWDPEDPGAGDPTPVDDMDEAFARHDYNYTIMSEREADKILIADLESLPKNTSNWRTPPTYPEYAEHYRKRATFIFKGKIAVETIQNANKTKSHPFQTDILPPSYSIISP